MHNSVSAASCNILGKNAPFTSPHVLNLLDDTSYRKPHDLQTTRRYHHNISVPICLFILSTVILSELRTSHRVSSLYR